MNSRPTDILFQRRSIRKYKKHQEIDKDTIALVLKAGMCAPTARNRQSWHFIVIDKRNVLDALAEMHPYGKMLFETPLAILVCGDLFLDDRESANALNGAAATQNILLAAHGEGLGAVWLGIYPSMERTHQLREILNFPNNVIPISLIAMGHPDEEKPANERYLEDRIHWNNW